VKAARRKLQQSMRTGQRVAVCEQGLAHNELCTSLAHNRE
jgi:hypothetical protein